MYSSLPREKPEILNVEHKKEQCPTHDNNEMADFAIGRLLRQGLCCRLIRLKFVQLKNSVVHFAVKFNVPLPQGHGLCWPSGKSATETMIQVPIETLQGQ